MPGNHSCDDFGDKDYLWDDTEEDVYDATVDQGENLKFPPLLVNLGPLPHHLPEEISDLSSRPY